VGEATLAPKHSRVLGTLLKDGVVRLTPVDWLVAPRTSLTKRCGALASLFAVAAAIKAGSLSTMFGRAKIVSMTVLRIRQAKCGGKGRVVVVAGDAQQSPLPNRRGEE
jgi:hypothetical protein